MIEADLKSVAAELVSTLDLQDCEATGLLDESRSVLFQSETLSR